jgi:hypothetical protein
MLARIQHAIFVPLRLCLGDWPLNQTYFRRDIGEEPQSLLSKLPRGCKLQAASGLEANDKLIVASQAALRSSAAQKPDTLLFKPSGEP